MQPYIFQHPGTVYRHQSQRDLWDIWPGGPYVPSHRLRGPVQRTDTQCNDMERSGRGRTTEAARLFGADLHFGATNPYAITNAHAHAVTYAHAHAVAHAITYAHDERGSNGYANARTNAHAHIRFHLRRACRDVDGH